MRAGVGNAHAAPVGLAGDQAVAFEQVADQHLAHGRVVERGAQQLRCWLVVRALQVKAVQVQAIEFMHRLTVKQFGQQDPHAQAGRLRGAAPRGLGEVGAQACLHGLNVGEAGVVEAVEVQLERFAFDDVGRLAGHGNVCQCHLGLAALVEPRQFERGPQIGTHERRTARDTDLGPLARARQGKQQRGIVLVDIGRRLAQGGLVCRGHVYYQKESC